MGEEKNAVEVCGLRKSYRDREVLRDVSFRVPRGKIYALLGSNGAGKTTTVRILSTQIPAGGGRVTIEGYDAAVHPRRVREAISLTGQFSAVDEALTGEENLLLMGRLRHIARPERTAGELLEAFGLSSCAKRRAGTYSGGMKRRLDIAMSLVGNPRVLFLDEPTTGLDPQSRRGMWSIIRRLNASGTTVFLTTQYLEEAEELADRIAILDGGRVIAEGTCADIVSCLPQGAAQFFFAGEEDWRRAAALLKDFRTADGSEECALTVYTDGEADVLARIFYTLCSHEVHIREFSQRTPKLEEAFLMLLEKTHGMEMPEQEGEKLRAAAVKAERKGGLA